MHIPVKPLSEYPFYLRWAFRQQEKQFGQVLLPALCWGRIPVLQVLFSLFWSYLDRKKSKIDPQLRALAQVRVAQLNWCAFCVDFNAMNLLTRTGSLNKLDHMTDWKNNTIFSEVEQDVLEYVEQVTKSEVSVSKELMTRLKTHFTDDQIVELTALIAFQNMSAKFNAALDIPAQGVCKIPKSP
jgi:AhpD family alkylhydroperoxidase